MFSVLERKSITNEALKQKDRAQRILAARAAKLAKRKTSQVPESNSSNPSDAT
jgi:hypothetical protein